MHLNATTALLTPTLLLVPYEPHHVPTYHAWMASPELQDLTASEPLTLEQEYDMQASWRRDGDKLTFIICLPLRQEEERAGGAEGQEGTPEVVRKGVDDAGERMVGDVNLFLFHEEGDDETPAFRPQPPIVGELELMIARPTHRRKGHGRTALLTFMAYVLRHWSAIAQEYRSFTTSSASFHATGNEDITPQLAYFRARINQSNEQSIRLFESLGFRRTSETANYFREVELRWRGDLEDLNGCKGWKGEGKQMTYG